MSEFPDTVPKQEVDDMRVMDVNGASNRLNTIGATLLRRGSHQHITSPFHIYTTTQDNNNNNNNSSSRTIHSTTTSRKQASARTEKRSSFLLYTAHKPGCSARGRSPSFRQYFSRTMQHACAEQFSFQMTDGATGLSAGLGFYSHGTIISVLF